LEITRTGVARRLDLRTVVERFPLIAGLALIRPWPIPAGALPELMTRRLILQGDWLASAVMFPARSAADGQAESAGPSPDPVHLGAASAAADLSLPRWRHANLEVRLCK